MGRSLDGTTGDMIAPSTRVFSNVNHADVLLVRQVSHFSVFSNVNHTDVLLVRQVSYYVFTVHVSAAARLYDARQVNDAFVAGDGGVGPLFCERSVGAASRLTRLLQVTAVSGHYSVSGQWGRPHVTLVSFRFSIQGNETSAHTAQCVVVISRRRVTMSVCVFSCIMAV